MEFQNLLLEEKEAGIYCLTINRPKAYNALNSQTLAEIQQVSDYLASRHNVRVLLLTGAGEKAFVAGADIKAMQLERNIIQSLFENGEISWNIASELRKNLNYIESDVLR